MMRATSAACIAWPARSAITWPSSGRPISARSPIRSSALWRQHSSGNRRPLGIQTPIPRETDGVLERGAADQSHVAHLVQLRLEPEGAGGRDLARRSAPGVTSIPASAGRPAGAGSQCRRSGGSFRPAES